MLNVGQSFGRYAVLETLGTGSFGAVYRAHDTLLRRDVALKVLLPHIAQDPEDQQRFLNEARALAALRHPNIVTVYDMGTEQGQPFFTMELVRGQTLAAMLASRGRLPLVEALTILRDIAAAVDHLHAAQLVHRDLKPANVMLETNGLAKLMDFGVARALNRTQLTQTGFSLGTLENASPEQVRGEKVGPAADIYALGILGYQLITGQPPFSGDVAHVVYAQVNLPPTPIQDLLPGIPHPVAHAIEAALAKEPSVRPTSGAAFLSMLDAKAQDVVPPPSVGGNPRVAPSPPPKPPVSSPQLAVRAPLTLSQAVSERYKFSSNYLGAKDKFWSQGRLSLTSYELKYTSTATSMPKRNFAIPYSEIQSVTKGRRRLFIVMVVITKSGGEHHFSAGFRVKVDNMILALKEFI